MTRTNQIARIAELSESEGVFTTAQAARMGIPRDSLHDAVESGRLERVTRGAYRLVGSGSSYDDEVKAIWKLTAPSRFTHERMRVPEWDGVVVGGRTAASLLGLGDFRLSPYRIFAPRRINSRNRSASFAKRVVSREDVSFAPGFPVTGPERTVSDLILDDEDLSLVADALRDAAYANRGFDFERLADFLRAGLPGKSADEAYEALLAESGLQDGKGE